MRRFLIFVFLSLLGLGLVAPDAAAGGKPTRETYNERGFYTSWRDRQKISADSYYRISWYVSAYDAFEGSEQRFRAYVSRYQSRCDVVTNARVRCHTVSRLVGFRRDPATVNFFVDKDLSSASMSGTWTLRQSKNHEVVDQKTVQLSVTLTARGEVSRSRDSYTRWIGNCPQSRYRFTSQYTRAIANVTVSGDLQVSKTRIKQASIYTYNGFVKHRKC
jgi:hypothetical protein